MKKIGLTLLLSASILSAFDLGSFAKTVISTTTNNSSSSTVSKLTSAASGLSNSTVTSGLKEALKQGVKYAVSTLGKKDGYLNNSLVKIPLPKNLQKVESLVRKAGGAKVADSLVNSMNEAASEAAPKSADIFMKAISKMSLKDAKKILAGDKDAATQYFKTHTSTSLQKMISPIVEKTMKKNSVIKYYDTFNGYYKKYGEKYVKNSSIMSMAKSFGADSYLPSQNDESLNQYVTNRAIDGLFKMIAQKEADIRKNPVARTTDLLKKVFK
jgi:hypothetical protein